MKFYVFIWSFFGGVFAASFFGFPVFGISLGLLVVGGGFLIWYGLLPSPDLSQDRERRKTESENDEEEPEAKPRSGRFLLGFIALISLAFGICRMEIGKWREAPPLLSNNLNKNVEMVGLVRDEPDQREKNLNLVISPKKISGQPVETKEKILVRTLPYSEFQYGDEVLIEGKLELPEEFDSESGRKFDYPAYLAKDNIYYLINRAEVETLSSGHGNFIKRKLFALKNAFLDNLNQALPEPHSGLAAGLIVAGKKSMPEDLLEEFKRAGVLHLVVLSGYNLTIVAEGMMKVFAFLPQAISLSLGAIGILLFALMAGGTSTVIRATVMALISLLARATHRTYQAKRALFAAAFCMVLLNPKILVFDSSFQLSFLATLGLIAFTPYFEEKLWRVPAKYNLRTLIASSLSTQVFVLPFLLHLIGQVSLVSLPASVLMLLLVPVTMLFGFLTGLASFISHYLAWPLAFISYLLLSYELFISRIFSRLPFALVSFSLPFFLAALIYGGYFFVYLYFQKQSQDLKNLKKQKRSPLVKVPERRSSIDDIKIIEG